MKILEFKNGFETINFNELQLSLSEKMVSGKSLNGIEHTELIDRIGSITSKYNAKLNPIIVSNAGPSKTPGISVLPYVESQKGKGAIEAHIFRRLIGGFEIETDNKEWNTKIAYSFHQGGIELAIGANVRVCSNLSIFGYENMVSTKNVPIDKMFEIVSDWITKYEEKLNQFEVTMKKLKENTFSLDKYFQFVGLLSAIRVEKDSSVIKNYINDAKVYGLNQGQINKFTEKALIEYSIVDNNSISAYDIYNIGTNLHKSEHMEISNIIPQNVEFGSTILNFIDNKLS